MKNYTVPWAERKAQSEKDKQIMLDKMKKIAYNTLGVKGVKPSSFSFDNPPLDYSSNKDQSQRTFEYIQNLLEEVTKICEKEEFPRPIMSGGAIRDAMLGFIPKDYDIFVDVTNIGDEELTQEDRFLLLADACFPEAAGWRYGRGGNDAYSKRPSFFQLYTGYNPAGIPVQLVGHNAPTVTTDPLTFTKDYPYNLIRNYATVDEIAIAPEAMLGFEKKIASADRGGYSKMRAWSRRHSMEGWQYLRHPEDEKTKAEIGLETFRQQYRIMANYNLQATNLANHIDNNFMWGEQPLNVAPPAQGRQLWDEF